MSAPATMLAEIPTARFRLRPLRPEDATERYSRWLDDGVAVRVIEAAAQPHAVENLRQYIVERQGRADVLFLGIFLREDGTHIGNIKYEPVDDAQGCAVMGILIGDPDWRGRGVAPEVIAASAHWLRDHRGIREIVLGVALDNTAAIRAYEKQGFRVEPTRHIAAKPEAVTMVWRLPARGAGA